MNMIRTLKYMLLLALGREGYGQFPVGRVKRGPEERRFDRTTEVAGLVDLMGGAVKFAEALDFVFDNGHCRHDNEPCHHYVYLYDHRGRHDMAQRRLPGILEANYMNSADGL